MSVIEEDKELQEMQQMEICYKKACELHRQYETQVIMRRLQFQKNCTHLESIWHKYEDVLTGETVTTEHCKRCKKLIKTTRE